MDVKGAEAGASSSSPSRMVVTKEPVEGVCLWRRVVAPVLIVVLGASEESSCWRLVVLVSNRGVESCFEIITRSGWVGA